MLHKVLKPEQEAAAKSEQGPGQETLALGGGRSRLFPKQGRSDQVRVGHRKLAGVWEPVMLSWWKLALASTCLFNTRVAGTTLCPTLPHLMALQHTQLPRGVQPGGFWTHVNSPQTKVHVYDGHLPTAPKLWLDIIVHMSRQEMTKPPEDCYERCRSGPRAIRAAFCSARPQAGSAG